MIRSTIMLTATICSCMVTANLVSCKKPIDAYMMERLSSQPGRTECNFDHRLALPSKHTSQQKQTVLRQPSTNTQQRRVVVLKNQINPSKK